MRIGTSTETLLWCCYFVAVETMPVVVNSVAFCGAVSLGFVLLVKVHVGCWVRAIRGSCMVAAGRCGKNWVAGMWCEGSEKRIWTGEGGVRYTVHARAEYSRWASHGAGFGIGFIGTSYDVENCLDGHGLKSAAVFMLRSDMVHDSLLSSCLVSHLVEEGSVAIRTAGLDTMVHVAIVAKHIFGPP